MNEWEEYQKMLSGKKTGASEWEEYQSMLSGGQGQAFERGDIPTTTTKPAPPQPAPTATPEKLDFQAWRYQDMQAPTMREATADVIPQNQTSRDIKLPVAPTPDKERRMPAFNNTGEPIVQGSLDRAPEGTRIQNTESPYWNLPAHQQKLVDMVMTGRDDIETKRVKVKKNFGFDPYTQPPYNLEGTGAGMTAAFIENMFSRVGTLPPAENANEMAVMGAGLAGSIAPGALVAGATGPLGNVAQGVITGAGANLAATPGNADREMIAKQILLGGLLGGVGGYGVGKQAPAKLGTASVEKRMQLKPWETPTQRMGAPEAPVAKNVPEPTVPKAAEVVTPEQSTTRQLPVAQLDDVMPETVRPKPTTPVEQPKAETPVAKEGGTTPPVEAIDDAAIPPKAPVEPTKTVDPSGDRISLKKAEIAKLRDQYGMEQIPEAERVSGDQSVANAIEGGHDTNALVTARRAIDSKYVPTTDEQAGMLVRIAQIKKELNAVNADLYSFREAGNEQGVAQATVLMKNLQDQFDTITLGSKMAGTERARGLRFLQNFIDTEDYSLATIKNRAVETKGRKLTLEESTRIEKTVAEHQRLTKELEELKATNERLLANEEKRVAERVMQAERARAVVRAKVAGAKEKILAERADIKKRLAELGADIKLSANPIDLEQLYLIGKLAVTYIHEGAVNLEQVLSKLRSDAMPNITDSDFFRALNTLDPKAKIRAVSEAAKRVKTLKTTARLWTEIEKAADGIFAASTGKPQSHEWIVLLRDKLDTLKREASDAGLDKAKIAKVNERIAEIQKQIDQKYRPVKPPKTNASPELKSARESLRDTNKAKNAQDRIADLEEQIRDAERGVFKPVQPRPLQKSDIRGLQRQLTQLRKEAYQSGIDGGRLERSLRKLNEVQDQLDNHYRAIKEKKPQDSPDMAETRQKIADLRKEMRLEDDLSDLNEQIRTGDYKVKEPRVERPEPASVTAKRIEIKHARNKIRKELERVAPMTTRKVVGEGMNILRAAKATADFSAALRQNAIFTITHPGAAAKNFGKAFLASFSETKAQEIDHVLRNREHYYLGEKSGLYLAELDGPISTREENFMSRAAEKIWGLGRIVRGSERNMVTQLNLMRSTVFDEFVRLNPNATIEELKAWADFVNKATGRGTLPGFQGSAEALSTIFFAPRFATSRFQTPVTLWQYRNLPRVRKAIAKELTASFVTGATALTLASIAGAEVSLDPNSADWGKVKIGNTRIDIWAGFQQPARLVARALQVGSDRSGLSRELGYRVPKSRLEFDPTETMQRFLSYKYSPVVTLGSSLISGRTPVGEKVTPGEALGQAFIPMVYDDIWDAYNKQGAGMAVAAGALNLVGVSTNTYQKKK